MCCFIACAVLLLFVQQNSAEKLPLKFGTKTPYHFDNSSFSKPVGCKPVHINMVLRHGSRYPSKGDRSDFKEIVQKLNALYNASSGSHSKNLSLPWDWPSDWEIAKNKELAERGEKEHYGIAKRILAKFPEVFLNRSYWDRYYKFVSSDSARTAQSAMSFAYGLFEGKGTVGSAKFQPVAVTFSGPEDNDKVLRPSDVCPRYEKDIEDGGGLQQYEDFKTGSEIKKVTEKLGERLNVSGKLELQAEELFNLCAFAVLLQNDLSWCSLFEKEDAEVLEYLNDLEAYYEHSYGNELSYQIICPLVGEIVDTIKEFTEERETSGIFRFSGSGTLTSLFTILGLFKDSVPLRADNYEKQTGRKFRTSENTPMAANVAFVLYECSSREGNSEFKVQLVINEGPVGMPCCYGNTTCSLQKFLSCYEDIGKKCDFEGMCQMPTTSSVSSKPTQASAASHVHLGLGGVLVVLFTAINCGRFLFHA